MYIKSTLLLVFHSILTFVINLFLYSFIHEMGHAIISTACGRKVNKLKLGLNAHIETEKAKYNKFMKCW